MTDFSAYLKPADWGFPVPIRYGPGRLSEIADLCRSHAVTNPLIVTDRASRNLPFIGQTEAALTNAGLAGAVFAEVSPNPTDRNVADGKAAYIKGGHDGVIAIGGGSGMDAGKAICLMARRARDIWTFDFDFTPDPSLNPADFPPLFCVPTTAGTGAETDSTAMLTDSQKRIKGCVWHPVVKPAGVILDPDLTVGLPRSLTAWTGIDALVHAIEAYCVPSTHPMCDGMALEALRLIAPALPRVLAAPDDIAARGAILTGSCLAGVAFQKGLGLVHAISHMIGAEFDSHHGLTNAVLLPVVLRFNQAEITAAVPQMAQVMHLPDTGFDGFLRGIYHLLDICDIPKSLADFGVHPTDIPRLAQKAHEDIAQSTNPRQASIADIEGLIKQALQAARP